MKMKNKLTGILFLFVCMLTLLLVPSNKAYAEIISSDGQWQYDLDEDDNTVSLQKYLGTATSLTFPTFVDGYVIDDVDQYCIKDNNTITSIIVPDNISLSGYAIYNCQSLQSLTFTGRNNSLSYYAIGGTFASDFTIYCYRSSTAYERFSSYTIKLLDPSVVLSSSSESIEINKTCKLKATLYNGNNEAIQWSSSDSSVATVNPAGEVEAKKPGTVTITASVTINGVAYSDTCSVTVKTPSIYLNKNYVTLNLGKTTKVKGTVENGTGTVKYSSSKKSVATVTSKGEVRAKTPGTTTITASVKIAGTTYKAKCTVKVAKPTLSCKKLTIYRGETYKLSVSNKGTKTVKWSSSSKSVATVKNGKITAKKKGSVAITAKVGNITLRCKVKVLNPYLSTNTIEVTTGFKTNLYVYGSSKTVKWSTSNSKIATVDSKGEITGKKTGKCYVYAKVAGVKLKCKVAVKKNQWSLSTYRRTELDSMSYETCGIQLRKAYFSGSKLVLEYRVLNKTQYTASKINYIDTTLYVNGTRVNQFSNTNIKVKVPSYSAKTVKVVIKSKGLNKVLDLRDSSWKMETSFFLRNMSTYLDGSCDTYSWQSEY